jgi:hypothetical protein
MPTPIPTNYVLYLDPLVGFTPGGTTWQDQSINEQVYTFNNTGYTYENTIGSFLLPTTTRATQDAPLPGAIPVGTSAITIIAWAKIDSSTMVNGDFFTVYALGRNGVGSESKSIVLKVAVLDNNPGGALTITPWINNSSGYRAAKFSGGLNTTYWTDSSWKMISITKPSFGTVTSQKLYVDGIELTSYATASVDYSVSTSVSNTPGGRFPRISVNDSINNYPSTIPGSVGEVWVYDQVLTQADLFNFYEQTVDRYYPAPPSKSDGRSFQQGFNG